MSASNSVSAVSRDEMVERRVKEIRKFIGFIIGWGLLKLYFIGIICQVECFLLSTCL